MDTLKATRLVQELGVGTLVGKEELPAIDYLKVK